MAPQTNKGIKPFPAFNTLINVLMGTGPILLPKAVAAAGYGYGLISLLLMGLFSMIACDYIVECLALANSYINSSSESQVQDVQQPRLLQVNNITSTVDEDQDQTKFTLDEQFEYGSMSRLFIGRKMEIFSVFTVVIYLFGALTSKGIIVGNSLSELFDNVPIMNNYYYWVIFFFTISGILSFKDISSISIVQTIVALVRYLTIVSMLVGSTMITFNDDYPKPQKFVWFDIEGLPQLLSTATLAYLMHHSSPGMLRPIEPKQTIRFIMLSAFFFGGAIFLIIPLTGMIAFPDLSKEPYYNKVFEVPPTKWAYYIISCYMFLNIAALPVLTITLRKNMMKLCVPHLMPKDSLAITSATTIFTFLIILPCATLALILKDQIELVVAFTGGICGVVILLVIPPLMVYYGRKNSIVDPQLNPFKSIFQGNIWIYILIGLGVIFIPYNLIYQIIKQYKKYNP